MNFLTDLEASDATYVKNRARDMLSREGQLMALTNTEQRNIIHDIVNKKIVTSEDKQNLQNLKDSIQWDKASQINAQYLKQLTSLVHNIEKYNISVEDKEKVKDLYEKYSIIDKNGFSRTCHPYVADEDRTFIDNIRTKERVWTKKMSKQYTTTAGDVNSYSYQYQTMTTPKDTKPLNSSAKHIKEKNVATSEIIIKDGTLVNEKYEQEKKDNINNNEAKFTKKKRKGPYKGG